MVEHDVESELAYNLVQPKTMSLFLLQEWKVLEEQSLETEIQLVLSLTGRITGHVHVVTVLKRLTAARN